MQQASLLRDITSFTCHMGSNRHSTVTCHPAEVTFPPLCLEVVPVIDKQKHNIELAEYLGWAGGLN